MNEALRGAVGLGVTLFVFAAGMATVNGLTRAWATRRLATNPQDATAQALLMLF